MARPTIRIDRSDPPAGTVVHLSVDNQRKLNVLDSGLVRLLIEHLDQLASEQAVRAVVLTGAGERAFIGGADMREMAGFEPYTARKFITGLHELCRRLREHPVPTIARINGYCLGGGMEIAASCDLRVASANARFGMPEVRVGIPSVIEAALLPRIIGAGRARDLVLTGDIISADDAYAMGFIRPPVAPADLDTAVERCLASVLAAGASAIRDQKALFKHWDSGSLEDAIDAGVDFFANAYRTPEPRRMMRSFLSAKSNGDSEAATEPSDPTSR